MSDVAKKMLQATAGAGGGGPFFGSISTNQQEMNLNNWALGQGWDGSSYAEITLESGVYVWSDDVSTPAMQIGSFPGGLKLIVNGFIIGAGGDGSDDGGSPAGQNGGDAISLGSSVTIEGGANGYIGGGGGGGGGATELSSVDTGGDVRAGGGGGAGGGNGGGASILDGGFGGSVGNAGGDGAVDSERMAAGDGGGSGGGGAGDQ